MVRIWFYILLCCIFVSVVFFAAFQYHSDKFLVIFSSKKFPTKSGDVIFQLIKEQENETEARTTRQKWIEMPPSNISLISCPVDPPKLVGPLLIEFPSDRTWENVTVAASPLSEGGRYRPSNCNPLQKVAIIIPYRNRREHLKHWLFYLHPILKRQQLDYGVYVINQHGDGVFNRAKLMNVGYVEALKEYDYDCFVFSDVDLIPMDDRNIYKCFGQPRHLSAFIDKFNFRLIYYSHFGGVCSFFKDHFLRINGFPNTYWGWGGEDDDVYNRIVHRGMSISRPDSRIGKYKMIKHQRDLHNEVNPKNPGKLKLTQSSMGNDGLNTLDYTVKEIVKDPLYTLITVDIHAPQKL